MVRSDVKTVLQIVGARLAEDLTIFQRKGFEALTVKPLKRAESPAQEKQPSGAPEYWGPIPKPLKLIFLDHF
jgi:hypothetical protein